MTFLFANEVMEQYSCTSKYLHKERSSRVVCPSSTGSVVLHRRENDNNSKTIQVWEHPIANSPLVFSNYSMQNGTAFEKHCFLPVQPSFFATQAPFQVR